MKYRGIFEYEYPTEHKPPISIDVHLHGDCVKGKIIEWEYRPLEQEPKSEWQQDHEILKAYSDGANEVLDKIRAEIESLPKIYPFADHIYTYIKTSDCLKIIDKYRSESEE